jgi:hypothetical protein
MFLHNCHDKFLEENPFGVTRIMKCPPDQRFIGPGVVVVPQQYAKATDNSVCSKLKALETMKLYS